MRWKLGSPGQCRPKDPSECGLDYTVTVALTVSLSGPGSFRLLIQRPMSKIPPKGNVRSESGKCAV
ncbi:MAG: hypothetical protein BroJett009_22710 [Armatimonadota bacterium]|nr:MAG: hypothetical protein BroJett009_22710 [Armatimonadota bacterium]